MADLVSQETVNKSFSDIAGLDNWILHRLKQLYLKHPTPVQYHCIPEILSGRNVLASAKTGSGKTLAFTLPVLQKLSKNPYGVFCLVLTPTRELAGQTAELIRTLGAPLNVQVALATGGVDYVSLGRELSGNPHVIVATPGRISSCLSSSPDFNLKKVKFLVFDEADRLWNGDFDNELALIMEALPPPEKRQTLMFTATVTGPIEKMKASRKAELYIWESKDNQATVEQLTQKYCLVNPIVREAALIVELQKFLIAQPKKLVLIFTDTWENAHLLNKTFHEFNIESLCLHSMMKQKDRLGTLSKFKSCKTKVLVSTDLASRGLDVPSVTLVINHRLPSSPETYLHRVGRTARFGRSGSSITFLIPNEVEQLLEIEKLNNKKMSEVKVDDPEVTKILTKVNIAMQKHHLHLEKNEQVIKKNINKRKADIMAGLDPDEQQAKREKREQRKREKEKINFWQVTKRKPESFKLSEVSEVEKTTQKKINISGKKQSKMSKITAET